MTLMIPTNHSCKPDMTKYYYDTAARLRAPCVVCGKDLKVIRVILNPKRARPHMSKKERRKVNLQARLARKMNEFTGKYGQEDSHTG